MVQVTADGGFAQGVIETLDFPTSVVIKENKSWSAVVHNIGDLGDLAFGVVNNAGNPGDVVVTYAGVETAISPGFYVRYYRSDQPNCSRLELDGVVRFLTEGDYAMRFWGMHSEADSWIPDDEQTRTVTVEGEPEPEPTIWEQIVEFAQEHPIAIVASVATPVMLALVGAGRGGVVVVERGRS